MAKDSDSQKMKKTKNNKDNNGSLTGDKLFIKAWKQHQ
jgi:hypothetical protein